VKLATLICPNCGQALTVLLIESDGFCACGLDYALHPTSGGMSANVRWTHDPKFPQSGDRDYVESISFVS
jgi:hypothetical protein